MLLQKVHRLSSINLCHLQTVEYIMYVLNNVVDIYCEKVKTLNLNCLPNIYKIKQSSKTNEGVSKCSKTGL